MTHVDHIRKGIASGSSQLHDALDAWLTGELMTEEYADREQIIRNGDDQDN